MVLAAQQDSGGKEVQFSVWRGRLKRLVPYFLYIILASGFFLRIYQLGRNSLWFDEVEQVLVEQQPTLLGALGVVRTYFMAMPLDYVVGWMVNRVCTTEACMRIPSAFGEP